jgi:hypothetical protein
MARKHELRIPGAVYDALINWFPSVGIEAHASGKLDKAIPRPHGKGMVWLVSMTDSEAKVLLAECKSRGEYAADSAKYNEGDLRTGWRAEARALLNYAERLAAQIEEWKREAA